MSKNIFLAQKLAPINPTNITRLLAYPNTFKKPILILTAFSIINSVLSVASAYIIKLLVDSALSVPQTQNALNPLNLITASQASPAAHPFVPVLIAAALLILLEIALSNLLEYYRTMQFTKEHAKLQKKILASFMEKTWLSLNQYRTGDLLTYVNNDTNRIITFWLNIFPSTLALIIHFMLAFALLFQFDPWLAFVSFIIAPLFLIFSYPITRKLKALQKNVQEKESRLQSHITESLQNISLIKIFDHRKDNLQKMDDYQKHLITATMRKSIFSLINSTILYIGYYIGYFLGLAFGTYRLSTGSITFGTFSALLNLIGQVQGPLNALGRTIPQYIVSLASSERLSEVQNLPEETTESNINANHHPPSDFQTIDINKISFSYVEGKPIFQDFSLKIKKGARLAIVGPSGCGKTTISRLLLSFVTPDSGHITITDPQGQNTPLNPHMRPLFSYVPQENILFSGSIRENLQIANSNATDEALFRALKIACADEFIAALPDSLSTIVGERGTGLSEGQIQRICIARAILYDKPILILDEATSALDEDTEQTIVHNLNSYFKDMTLIAITHRPSIKNICEQVISLKATE